MRCAELKSVLALNDADLLVLAMRRRRLPVTQMDHLDRYIRAGKPVLALRVSIVPFQVPGLAPPGQVVWDRFDQEVLGCNYGGFTRDFARNDSRTGSGHCGRGRACPR